MPIGIFIIAYLREIGKESGKETVENFAPESYSEGQKEGVKMSLDRGRVLVGMSGGVDSSAAVCLLQKEGYQVAGLTLLLTEGACAGSDSVRDAAAVARKLGIPHAAADGKGLFRREVQDYFASSYEHGLTPNPCIQCNRKVKFAALLEEADRQGSWYVATGHYARIEKAGDRYLLMRGLDQKKDQSYFLYGLTREQLRRTLFPLGSMSKEECRAIAEAHGLINARKKDSQDICFIPDGDYGAFLERHTGKTWPSGDFVDKDGNVLGKHQGHVRYTLGQRRGLNIALGQRAYVVGKDPETNTVTLGANEDLFTTHVRAREINFLACDDLKKPARLLGRTRYTQQLAPCTACQTGEDELEVIFDQPQRAVTPGQAVVLYDGETVVCGGTIV